MAGTRSTKRAEPPQDITQPPSKRPAMSTSKRADELFSETRGGDSHYRSYASTAHTSSRKQREELHTASPSVRLLPLEPEEEVMPEEIVDFFSNLLDKLESAIPESLVSLLKAHDLRRPDVAELLKDEADHDAVLWKYVRSVVEESNVAFASSGDETVWSDIVRPLLERAMGSRKGDLFLVKPIQTTPIAPPSLIPTLDGLPIAFKKIDFAVVFSETHPEVKDLYRAVRLRHLRLKLCQSDDLALGPFSQFAGIEVKSPDGSYYAASVQLAVWLSAGLEKMRQLQELATEMKDEAVPSQEPLLPFMGIAVTGHVWNLHLATKADDGTVQIYGPLVIGDTATSRGVFRLIAALDYIRTWGETVYYPWLRDTILAPLGRESAPGTSGGGGQATTAGPTRREGRGGGRGGGRGRGGRGGKAGRGGKSQEKGKE